MWEPARTWSIKFLFYPDLTYIAARLWFCHYYSCSGSKHMTGAAEIQFTPSRVHLCFIYSKAPMETTRVLVAILVNAGFYLAAMFYSCRWSEFCCSYSCSPSAEPCTRMWSALVRWWWDNRPERLWLCCSDTDVSTGSWGLVGYVLVL